MHMETVYLSENLLIWERRFHLTIFVRIHFRLHHLSACFFKEFF